MTLCTHKVSKYMHMICLHSRLTQSDIVDVVEGSRTFSVSLKPRSLVTVIWNQ